MPKDPPTLYNHSQRTTASRIYHVEHAPRGRSSIVTTSNHHIVSLPERRNHVELNAESTPMDIDRPDGSENCTPEDISGVEAETDRTIPGVRVVPRKEKAKRYENSVSCYFT